MLALRSLGKIKGVSRIKCARVHDFLHSLLHSAARMPDEYRER